MQCHGSQCGFCTPGFVMSLFGMYQNHVAQGRSHHPRTGAGGAVGQPVPLHRLQADPGRGADHGRTTRRCRSTKPALVRQLRSSCSGERTAERDRSRPIWRRAASGACSQARAAHPAGADRGRLHRRGPVGHQDAQAVRPGARRDPGRRTAPHRALSAPRRHRRGRHADRRLCGAGRRTGRSSRCSPTALPACRCATPARWAATWPTARRSATACRC